MDNDRLFLFRFLLLSIRESEALFDISKVLKNRQKITKYPWAAEARVSTVYIVGIDVSWKNISVFGAIRFSEFRIKDCELVVVEEKDVDS